MSNVVVRPVASRSDRRKFLDLPWKLYRDDPQWMPPLLMNQRELLGWTRKKHPFYDNAESQSFLAERGGEVCGRITAIVNGEHNRIYNEQRGFWGFFESINDPAVSNALFDAVRQWHAERNIHLLRGPTNPSMNYECGLLVEGFAEPVVFMLTYNPPFYEQLVETAGYQRAHDLVAYSGHVSQLNDLPEKITRVSSEAVERLDMRIRELDTGNFMEEVKGFLRVYNDSLARRQWGFVPLPQHEMNVLARSMKMLIEPELALSCEVDGEMVGAVLCLPDYNPRIKDMNGRLFPFGFLKLLKKPRPLHRVRVLSINVLPEYRAWGVGLVLLTSLVPKALQKGVEFGDFSWISEANDMARGGLEKAGGTVDRRWRMYDLDLTA